MKTDKLDVKYFFAYDCTNITSLHMFLYFIIANAYFSTHIMAM